LSDLILGGVMLLNRIVVTGVLITAFALVIYLGLYNRYSRIARTFSTVLLCVMAAYFFDLLAQLSHGSPWLWLRLQWLGIAFIPAASLDLSDALLRATGETSPTRRTAVLLGYAAGLAVFLLVMFTDFVATPGISEERLPHLKPGLLYLPFTFSYFASVLWSTYNVVEARRRSLTTTSKRRMTYFMISFAAPALAMFPYLLPSGWPDALPDLIPWLAILLANMGVGAAATGMGYPVAYFGASSPDRIVKRRLIKYLLRGPLLAAIVITALALSTRVERWLGIDGPVLGFILAASIILSAQLFIVTLQPMLDRFIAGDDADEVRDLQHFSERLMTTSDLTQYLENILAALCDLLRARTAFVSVLREDEASKPTHVVTIGSTDMEQIALAPEVIRRVPLPESAPVIVPSHADGVMLENGHAENGNSIGNGPIAQWLGLSQENIPPFDPGKLVYWNGYWLIPLREQGDGAGRGVIRGVIGLLARGSEPDLTSEERKGLAVLVDQAERAISDSIKQQLAFAALERIMPGAEDMQRRMAGARNPAAPTLQDFEFEPANRMEFTQQVRDALTQFWGGPKLTSSPLLGLAVVESAMKENNGNATRALRAVLTQAIERLKPDGQRSMTAAEWMLYNIMEMKVLQDLKVRDIARRIVISESDLYRKQRAAFEEVAKIVIDMEREARKSKVDSES